MKQPSSSSPKAGKLIFVGRTAARVDRRLGRVVGMLRTEKPVEGEAGDNGTDIDYEDLLSFSTLTTVLKYC